MITSKAMTLITLFIPLFYPAWRNSYQPVLVRIYNCAILEVWLPSEAWLPFMTCWICILRTSLSGWSFLFRIYANCRPLQLSGLSGLYHNCLLNRPEKADWKTQLCLFSCPLSAFKSCSFVLQMHADQLHSDWQRHLQGQRCKFSGLPPFLIFFFNEPDCSKKFAMAISLAAAVSVANLQNSVHRTMVEPLS